MPAARADINSGLSGSILFFMHGCFFSPSNLHYIKISVRFLENESHNWFFFLVLLFLCNVHRVCLMSIGSAQMWKKEVVDFVQRDNYLEGIWKRRSEQVISFQTNHGRDLTKVRWVTELLHLCTIGSFLKKMQHFISADDLPQVINMHVFFRFQVCNIRSPGIPPKRWI